MFTVERENGRGVHRWAHYLLKRSGYLQTLAETFEVDINEVARLGVDAVSSLNSIGVCSMMNGVTLRKGPDGATQMELSLPGGSGAGTATGRLRS